MSVNVWCWKVVIAVGGVTGYDKSDGIVIGCTHTTDEQIMTLHTQPHCNIINPSIGILKPNKMISLISEIAQKNHFY